MKRALILTAIIFIAFSINSFAADRLTVSIHGNYLVSSDEDFKTIYGSGRLFPELKAGVKIFKDLHIWAAVGFFSDKGTTPILQADAKTNQTFISGGIGYTFNLTPKLNNKIEIGFTNINYKEESMGEEYSDSAFGFRIEDEIMYSFGKQLYLSLNLGYIAAKDTVEDLELKPGGLKVGVGIGLKI